MQPRLLSAEHNTGLSWVIVGTPVRERKKEKKEVGGLMVRVNRNGGYQKGHGTASEGYKSSWKCLPQKAVVSTLNSTPSLHPLLFPCLKALRRLMATGDLKADKRGNRGSRFVLMCCSIAHCSATKDRERGLPERERQMGKIGADRGGR